MKPLLVILICALLLSLSACGGTNSDLAACQAKAERDGLSGPVRVRDGKCEIQLNPFVEFAPEWREVP